LTLILPSSFCPSFPSLALVSFLSSFLLSIMHLSLTHSMMLLVSNLNITPQGEVLKLKYQFKQSKLDSLRRNIQFGPEPTDLPVWSWETFQKRVEEGEPLMVIDDIVHDLKNFFDEVSSLFVFSLFLIQASMHFCLFLFFFLFFFFQHPGGAEILRPKIGKDATVAFNGGVQRHSKAARNLASLMRVAVLEKKN